MAPKRVHIRGERGRWVAEVEGRWPAVLHHTQHEGTDRYSGPSHPEHVGTRRYGELIGALKENDLIVLQRDKDPVSLTCDGYVGVFRFEELVIEPGGVITRRPTSKYAEAAR